MTMYSPDTAPLFVAIFLQNFFVIYSLFDRNLVLDCDLTKIFSSEDFTANFIANF